MKAIIHVGMPKAASTAMQNTLSAKSDEILAEYGVLYATTSGTFNNHHDIFGMHAAGQRADVIRYLEGLKCMASERGAHTVLLSSEDFLFAPNYRDFADSVLACGFSLETVVVVRNLRHFLFSYLRQLLANGSIELENDYLASFVASKVLDLKNSDLPSRFLSYERALETGRPLNALLSGLLSAKVEVSESRQNVTPTRSLAFGSALGIACKLRSARLGHHINGSQMDAYRTEQEIAFDASIVSVESSEYATGIGMLDRILEDEVYAYIDHSLAIMEPETKERYRALLEKPITLNLAARSANRVRADQIKPRIAVYGSNGSGAEEVAGLAAALGSVELAKPDIHSGHSGWALEEAWRSTTGDRHHLVVLRRSILQHALDIRRESAALSDGEKDGILETSISTTLVAEEVSLMRWFDELRIRPLVIWYEDLFEAPKLCMYRIARWLGSNLLAANVSEAPPSRRQPHDREFELGLLRKNPELCRVIAQRPNWSKFAVDQTLA